MGHLNKKYLSLLRKQAEGIAFGTPKKHKYDCSDCVKANQRKQILRCPVTRPDRCLDVIYTDICGPMQENDFWGHRYYVLFVCAKSRYKWIYLLFKRDQAAYWFKQWKAYVERRYKNKIKTLHSDGGGEYMEKEFQAFLTEEGIIHITTPPYSPEMNGSAEVWNRVIVSTASAMLHTSELNLSFWGQAALCATYLLNRSPTKGLKLCRTPYQELNGRKPYVGNVRTWGYRAYAHIKKESKKRKKWDSHSRECILMGYYDSENVFKLDDIEANSLLKVRDAIFFEEILGHESLKEGSLSKEKNILGEEMDPGLQRNAEVPVERVEPDNAHREVLVAEFTSLLERNTAWTREVFLQGVPPANIALEAKMGSTSVQYNFKLPLGYKRAMKHEHARHWKLACDEEFAALKRLKTWILVPRTAGMKVIQHK